MQDVERNVLEHFGHHGFGRVDEQADARRPSGRPGMMAGRTGPRVGWRDEAGRRGEKDEAIQSAPPSTAASMEAGLLMPQILTPVTGNPESKLPRLPRRIVGPDVTRTGATEITAVMAGLAKDRRSVVSVPDASPPATAPRPGRDARRGGDAAR